MTATNPWIDAAMLLAWCVCSIAWAFLAMGQERHRARVGAVAVTLVVPSWLGPIAFVLLALALVVCVATQGPGFGALLWAVMLSATALLLTLTLTWWPAALRPVARCLDRLTIRRDEALAIDLSR